MHSRGVKEVMMIDFSIYDDLDELLEIQKVLEDAIEKKKAEERNMAFEQEDMQLEESLEEFRDETLPI
jgi:hypothetical protein